MPVRAAAAISSAAKRRTHRRNSSEIKKKPSKKFDPEANIGFRGNNTHDKCSKWFRTLRDKKWFQTSIIIVIFLAGILVGIQTYDIQDESVIDVTTTLDELVMAIFIIEIVVKMAAEGHKPLLFFKDAWNVFDFFIVVVGLMPFGGGAVTALRLVRLLRVLKLVRALPKLRILVMGLLRSLSSIAYIGLLLGLLFYLYAVLGVSVFGANDPVLMGTLHIAFLTLFRCATLEDWTDVMYIAMEGCENYGYDGIEDKCTDSQPQGLMGAIYFCSFIILSSMMILNLFIGVITTSMQEAKTALTAEMEEEEDLDDDEMMLKRLDQMSEDMEGLAEEMAEFAAQEKEKMVSAVVHLSRTSVLDNVESVTPTNVRVVRGAGDGSEEFRAKPRRSSPLVWGSRRDDTSSVGAGASVKSSQAGGVGGGKASGGRLTPLGTSRSSLPQVASDVNLGLPVDGGGDGSDGSSSGDEWHPSTKDAPVVAALQAT